MAAGATTFNIRQISKLPITAKDQTEGDPVLSKVLQYTQNGWPHVVPTELKPFYQRQNELTIEAGCLLWGTKVVIPERFQAQLLSELHVSHPGIVRMKGLARAHVWWPGMSGDIEKTVRSCGACQSIRNRPPPVVLHSWPWPTGPWERIHVDYIGPFMGSMFLIVVDAFSKWLEVIHMTSTTTEKTLDALYTLFARYGLPKKVVSDNGPQFIASSFVECMAANGIEHLRSAPYHPATNGEAERFVQTFNNSLKAGQEDKGTLFQKLSRFLFMYRITPHSTTGVPPTELFLKRQVRTRFDLCKPSIREHVLRKQKQYHDTHAREQTFEVGQRVFVLNPRGNPKWLRGKIIEKTGPVSFKVEVEGRTWRCHVNQLLRDPDTETEETSGGGEPEDGGCITRDVLRDNERTDLGKRAQGHAPCQEDIRIDDDLQNVETETIGIDDGPPNVENEVPSGKRYPQRNRSAPTRFEPTI